MKKILGIELGSTRIKAVLIDETCAPFASGAHSWENRFENGFWTYSLDDAWSGIQDAYTQMAADYENKTGKVLVELDGLGISGMMHGYLAFDMIGKQLTPFRTWRNTTTGEAAETLSNEFGFRIPQRWSIAHLYQALLNQEPHTNDISFLTTLAGYVHWKLTGRKAAGICEASGMLPLDGKAYDAVMAGRFEEMTGINIVKILPEILNAGENAGYLTAEGAELLDPSGRLLPGVPLCPPEGDAGTGMAATNSIGERTGNISAGTSVFAVLNLEKPLSKQYKEIDIASSPAGRPIAMVHGANGTPDLDAWVSLFSQTLGLMGAEAAKPELYDALYQKALEGDPDCGGLLSYNYLSGEHLTGFSEGRPLFTRLPDSRLSIANFMRAQLFSAMIPMKIGLETLTGREEVQIDRLTGHGGLFKAENAGQRLMAAALGIPVSVLETAGEGGAWGMALLAAYMERGRPGGTLEAFLSDVVFAGKAEKTANPDKRDAEGFAVYIERYKEGLAIERAAVEHLNG
ncbi:MAG: FGGY-family carbohydrate kinase [Oscillospiraceae bacterium]|nr:FGGY-family carbohydrate kinase [Oscillospiraceae bacterium]